MLAVLGCLLAAAQVHAHEAGLYDIQHSCISCDFEDIAAHGAAPVAAFALTPQLPDAELYSFYGFASALCLIHTSIRAPPQLS